MNQLTLQLITGAIIGLGAGYLGSFMVLRRMSLVGDALSHVALPGIAVALLLQINPFFGAFTALALAILIIWGLEKRTALPSETLVGIMFTLSLALGLLLTPEPELLEALFGDIARIGQLDLWLSVLAIIVIFGAMMAVSKNLIISILSKDLARSMKVNVDGNNLLFLFLVAIVVALGLKVAGTLLMGSLVIIPAAAAKNISNNLTNYTRSAAFFGAVSAIAGILAATYFQLAPGPMVVLASGAIFLATLFFKR